MRSTIVEREQVSESRTRLAWLGMVLAPGMGAIRTVRAASRLGTAARMMSASLTELEGAGMPAAAAQFCFDGRATKAAEEEMRRVEEAGGRIVTIDDALYPEALRNIYDPAAMRGSGFSYHCIGRPAR